ncbi:CdaR family transcriptional regulator [Streptomyces globisporus]|uniref:PucR family transcriptional regulator n=1 Tax=Streptomyces globisporus TaxID=1908 RepID=UPI00131D9E94|nr:helix-turn-helix domain-containing protein [Streptomyces globisporus]
MSQQVPEGVARLAARIEPQINRLARHIIERQRAEVPGFDRLPSSMQDLEIAATARHAVRGFLHHIQGQPDADTELFRRRAVQRAEEGIPLARLLRTYHVGVEVLLDALSAETHPGEEADLLWLVRQLLRALNVTVEEVTEAYLAGLAVEHAAIRELAWALIRGEQPEEMAARCGLALAPAYLVLSIRTTEPPEPLAARRLLRQVVAQLAPLADGHVLSLQDEFGGHVLLPAGLPPQDIARRLATGPGQAPIVGAAPAATPGDVPAAAERADLIAALAGRPGVHQLQDVLLDYCIARPADSATELAAILEPLDRHPELTATLAAFLDCDLDRRRAAHALGVHPNTVDNRLARTTELTGLDPRTTRGVQLFGAAFAIRRQSQPRLETPRRANAH